MPTNLELKIRLKNPGKVYKKITELNARSIGELDQTDIYYKNEKYRIKLRLENENQTLIKYLRNEGEGERWSDFEIIKLEQNDARKYLSDILQEEIVVEKKRKLFLYDNTRIHIDQVKGLGDFLELETLLINGKKEASARFNKIKSLLSIREEKEIRKSYRDLMMENKGK